MKACKVFSCAIVAAFSIGLCPTIIAAQSCPPPLTISSCDADSLLPGAPNACFNGECYPSRIPGGPTSSCGQVIGFTDNNSHIVWNSKTFPKTPTWLEVVWASPQATALVFYLALPGQGEFRFFATPDMPITGDHGTYVTDSSVVAVVDENGDPVEFDATGTWNIGLRFINKGGAGAGNLSKIVFHFDVFGNPNADCSTAISSERGSFGTRAKAATNSSRSLLKVVVGSAVTAPSKNGTVYDIYGRAIGNSKNGVSTRATGVLVTKP